MLASQQFSAFTAPTELFFYVCLGMAVCEGEREAESVMPRPRNWMAYWSGICLFALPFIWFAAFVAAGDGLLASARRCTRRRGRRGRGAKW